MIQFFQIAFVLLFMVLISLCQRDFEPPLTSHSDHIDTIAVNTEGSINISKMLNRSDITGASLQSAPSGSTIQNNCYKWSPGIADTGIHNISLRVYFNSGDSTNITITLFVSKPWPDECPIFTHKNDETIGNQVSLPEGFFVFERVKTPGLYKSPIQQFIPILLQATKSDYPISIMISDNGKWILYLDGKTFNIYLIQSNGCNKVKVPVVPMDSASGFPGNIGFYRNSPYGNEIWYVASFKQIHAVQVDLSDTIPRFGADRVIADVGPEYGLTADNREQISVSGNQIFGYISPVGGDTFFNQVGFATIPQNGLGTATSADVYKWKSELHQVYDGCGFTMSFDGNYTLANAGRQGSDCVPKKHLGFFVTPFFKTTMKPVDIVTEYIDLYGTSINWCPRVYRIDGTDFWGWDFTNNNSYVCGRLGTTYAKDGAWMINWRTNTWTPLSPPDSNITIYQPSAHFGPLDTGTNYLNPDCDCDTGTVVAPPSDDPMYQIIKPAGGELFSVAQICTIKVAAAKHRSSVLQMSIDNGKQYFELPGFIKSIDPQIDSVYLFTIPDSVVIGTVKKSSKSTQVRIRVAAYFDMNYNAISKAFTITN